MFGAQEIIFVQRLFLAVICSSFIGYERKSKMKEAGIKTHCIVGLASCLLMVISKYGFTDAVSGDGSRIAAQVVSGIGFLGAGMIFVKNDMVSGLTTAAGIWATAGVGMAIGAGMYEVGIITSVMIVIIQVLTPFIEKTANDHFRIITKNDHLEEVLIECRKYKIQSFTIDRFENNVILDVSLTFPNDRDREELLEKLMSLENVIKIEN